MMRILAFLLAGVVFASAACAQQEESLPVLYAAPNFHLTDQNGQAVSLSDLRGKAWVVDFIFTQCAGPCPVMTSKMVGLTHSIHSPNVRFVSFSVDPANDTPAVLRQYAKDRGATDPRIHFLTGDPKNIYDLVQSGFKLTAQPASKETPILHDEHFLLVDGDGNVRGAYMSNDDEAMARLVSDANTLAAQGVDWIARFPAINASLNATAGILLCIALMLIKANKVRAHAVTMILALVASTAFLACYVTFHYLKVKAGVTVTRFPDHPLRPVYLGILLSHTVLAIVVVPLVIMTVVRAARRQWDRHRRIASPTFWMWLYVSVTGVVVYWMLYQLAPRLG
jgi:protein SCO1/2/putative membrane protein